MKNFPIKHEGSTFWISRAIGVASFVFAKKDGKLYVLANKRGDGVPDFRGFWNVPCGFLDYDETIRQAAAREVFEETGLQLASNKYKLFYINDDPMDSNNQNVTFRFYVNMGVVDELPAISMDNMEDGEVSDVKWVDVMMISNHKWAFNHNNIIKEIVVQKNLYQ
jgi:8-oxo-dGTP pyrophosphatase MutT (NUDIX family)